MLPQGLVSAAKLAFRVCMAGHHRTVRIVLVSLLFLIFAGIRLPAQTRHFGCRAACCSRAALTFISDGVVEARNGKGELYGFARTRNMSGESAETIARTAQLFGQEGDITVLTVVRVPATEAATA